MVEKAYDESYETVESFLDEVEGKIFSITERMKFKLQWEAYNAFNRANYSNPNGNVDQSTAGVISGVADIMRQMQLGGTLTF